MLISISVSHTSFKKGDRVIVRIESNQWYTGVIKSAGQRLSILFDDGDKSIVESESYAHVKLLTTNKVSKTPFTNAEAKLLSKAETAPKTKVVPKLDRYLECAESQLFAKANTPSAMLTYLKTVFAKANDLIFDNRMIMPNIYLMKLQKLQKVQKVQSFRGRGLWKPRTRQLGISPRVFNAGESAVLCTFVHEMCHQAVSEIDKVIDKTAGGHGPNWVAWMQKTDIPVSRYDTTDTM